ncbi:MAG: MBL fold metallo-hydrolase RNA specificity domain-containing protein [Candidatus Berkiellales bacterium]
MEIQFLGAAQTVTGSKYLLNINSKKILIDCGLFQGLKELRLRNWDKLPIDPKEIDMVILTHAHIDHSGYLPLLVKNGFRGPIYATLGTKDLCAILLPDSGHLQEEEAAFANKYGYSKHHPAKPLYTRVDAEKVLSYFKPVPYDQKVSLEPELTVTFKRAGHIIGASFIELNYKGIKVVFSGDMGKMQDLVMRAPEAIHSADYLILESTYGDKRHENESPVEYLGKIINKTAARGGSVIIPAFAVGRAQNLLYYIYLLKTQRKIPDLPVFLDSPMAIKATELLHRHREDHRLSKHECQKIGEVATYINTVEDSKRIDHFHYPIVIISASGMATGGRVLHHLKLFAPESRNTILFTGYQVPGTRGARMVNHEKSVKIHGNMVPIEAEVVSLPNSSAHADYEEILAWLGNIEKAPKKVFITHGEVVAANSLKAKIEQNLHWECIVPSYLQREKLE